MDQNSVEHVVKLFKEGNVSTIVLSGKSGTGKTWIARKVGLRAVKEKVVDFTLWICLSVKHDERSLYELVAHQLSLFSPSVEMESDGNEEVDGMVSKEETLEVLKEKVRVRLSADGVLRRILVILDDEGNKINEGDPNLEQLLQFVQQNSYKPSSTVANGSGQGQEKVKVLITSHNEGDRHKTEVNKKVVVNMKPLTPDMSISLLRQKAGVQASESSDVKTLIENFIIRKTSFTPGEVTLLAKLLSCHQLESGLQDLENDLEEASRGDIYNYTHLLFRGCEKIPDGVSVDFSWQGSHLFRDIGSVHYGELISYWIMEGYLGPINGLEKAYEEGHKILMQLMDCQMLKKVNEDFLHMASAIVDFADHHRDGYGGTANLGLAYVLADICAWDGFGKVTKMDGRIGTLGIYRKGHQLTTLLLDGNCLSGKDPNHLIQTNQELQNLGLFSLRFVSLPRSLSYLSKLTVLVLRSCDFLESIDDIKKLGMLSVLEVSGSCLVKSIPSDFFYQLTKLRSLHFSDLQIEELPTSFYDLTELRWLILKGCSHLTQLQSLRKSEKLLVVDLSGSSSLTNFSDKNLKALPKLKILNLSGTNIKVLPIFRETGELTHLSLSGCRNMDRLPSIRTLTNLQVLDISGSTIREFHDRSFQSNSSLKILDLSETMIPSHLMPATISKAREFYLRNCCGTKYVKCEFAKDLEVLDFSGSYNLVKVYKSFARLENLRVLNMSKTKVEDLPPLSALHNLRRLLLSSCLNLKKLPNLTSSKLEELDLSDCNALTFIEDTSFEHLPCLRRLILSKTNIERLPALSSLTNLEELNLRGVKSVTKADFLERMSKLKYLDLSETALEQLPTLSNLKDLNHLFLRGCRQLETLQPLEELQKLEILDLSQTAIRHLPSLGNFSNLRSLLLGDCPNLENFKNIKVLDLSGDIINNLPYEISRLTQLEHFAFPSMKNIQAVDSNDMSCSQEKLNTIEWYISSFAGMAPNTDRSFMSVSSSGFLELRQSSPSIWDPTLNHFHLSVQPIKLQKGTGVFFFHKDEFIFRDIYLLSRHYESKDPGRLLEVHHLRTFPTGIEDVLSHAEYIFLFDNLFIKSLADLGADSIKKLKGCWMEGCQNMEVVIKGNDAGHTTELGLTLEILWISNASSLRSIYDENLHSGGFQHLKCLHLDCCPMLSRILFSSHLLQKLEILHVRFCDKLETLFEHDNEEHMLPNLRTLRLWELPELKGIGCPMPSLQFLEVGECPLLRHVLSASHVPDKLEVLKVRNCVNLDNLLEGFTSENCKLSHLGEVRLWGLPKLTNLGIEAPLLRTLEVGDCPLLKHVISSTQMPEDLKVLKVRFCDNLDTLFDGIIPENCILPRLDIVQLWHLPKLTSIGITLPAVVNVIIRECPELTMLVS